MTATNAQIVEAFRNAKPMLSSSYHTTGLRYICWAIEDGNRIGGNITLGGFAAKAVINNRLGDSVMVHEWLAKHVPGAKAVIIKDKTGVVMQAYRHRWVDALIEEFGG